VDRSTAGTPTAALLVIRPGRRLSAALLVSYLYPLLRSCLFHGPPRSSSSDFRVRYLHRIPAAAAAADALVPLIPLMPLMMLPSSLLL
jgi:hypothetical protein